MMYWISEWTGILLCHLQHFLIFPFCDLWIAWGGKCYHDKRASDPIYIRGGVYFTKAARPLLKTGYGNFYQPWFTTPS